jgi:hypothetical protein
MTQVEKTMGYDVMAARAHDKQAVSGCLLIQDDD